MSTVFETLGVEHGTIVLWAAFLVWLIVVGCAVSSVLAQSFSRRQKIAWVSVILFVPLIGLMAYLPFSIRKSDLPLLFQSKQ